MWLITLATWPSSSTLFCEVLEDIAEATEKGTKIGVINDIQIQFGCVEDNISNLSFIIGDKMCPNIKASMGPNFGTSCSLWVEMAA